MSRICWLLEGEVVTSKGIFQHALADLVTLWVLGERFPQSTKKTPFLADRERHEEAIEL